MEDEEVKEPESPKNYDKIHEVPADFIQSMFPADIIESFAGLFNPVEEPVGKIDFG